MLKFAEKNNYKKLQTNEVMLYYKQSKRYENYSQLYRTTQYINTLLEPDFKASQWKLFFSFCKIFTCSNMEYGNKNFSLLVIYVYGSSKLKD